MELYPEIGLKQSLFHKIPVHYWTPENQKQFFDAIATTNNFDPLVAANWYPFSNSDIQKIKVK